MKLFSLIVTAWLVFTVPAHAQELYTVGFGCFTEDKCEIPELENVIREAYSRIGVQIKAKRMPLMRDLVEANENLVQASAFRSEHAVSIYNNLLLVPTPLFYVEYCATSLNPAIVIKDWNDLKPFSVGVLRGDILATSHLENNGVKIYPITGMEQGYKMLEANRLDAIISVRVVAENAAKALGVHAHYSDTLLSKKIYHSVNKQHASLIPALSEAFTAMQQDGSLHTLLGDYNTIILPRR